MIKEDISLRNTCWGGSWISRPAADARALTIEPGACLHFAQSVVVGFERGQHLESTALETRLFPPRTETTASAPSPRTWYPVSLLASSSMNTQNPSRPVES